MTISFRAGPYDVRIAASAADLRACQRLRHRCFFGRAGVDADAHDPGCRHLMVLDHAGRLLATARVFPTVAGAPLLRGYTAAFYDLSALAGQGVRMLELGRFCAAPEVFDPQVLRAAWGVLTRLVDAEGAAMIFGCSSFAGVAGGHEPVFARLARRHLGPAPLRPGVAAAEVVRFAKCADGPLTPMPPLLRSYLAMGGWVGDHAVVDRAMDTLHVFTCLEVAKVPPVRARSLRALAQEAALS